MDITKNTKQLIIDVQKLKSKYSDLASVTFLDFYCQCREGCDYLFAKSMKKEVRILDILNWFLQAVENRSFSLLITLMCRDIIGPSLPEFQQDEETENSLKNAFKSEDLQASVLQWDCQRNSDGSVNLILRNLLQDIENIEIKSQEKLSSSSHNE
jgi:hypothetical protein